MDCPKCTFKLDEVDFPESRTWGYRCSKCGWQVFEGDWKIKEEKKMNIKINYEEAWNRLMKWSVENDYVFLTKHMEVVENMSKHAIQEEEVVSAPEPEKEISKLELKTGEWAWCKKCNKPHINHIWGGEGIEHVDGDLEPLAPHLPILEYDGFEVEEIVNVKLENGYAWNGPFKIEGFNFPYDGEVWVSLRNSKWETSALINAIEHIPPDQKTKTCGLPATVKCGDHHICDPRCPFIDDYSDEDESEP